MSTPANCATSCCPEVENTQTPGPEGIAGTAGTNGSDGASAFTSTTALVAITNVGDPYVLPVMNNTTFAVGQPIFVSDGTHFATFVITSKTGTTTISGTFIGAGGDTTPPFDLASGALVVPTGTEPVFTGLPNAFTDNSGGTQSNVIAAGVGIHTLSFAIQLASMTTAAAALATTYVPGYAFAIIGIHFAATTLGVGAAASQAINIAVDGVNLTGGVLTLTEANTTPLGNLVDATTITVNATGNSGSSFSIKVAAGGTVFTAGAGVIFLRIQNLDERNAAASFAAHINALITALT